MKALFLDMFLLLLIFVSIREGMYRLIYKKREYLVKNEETFNQQEFYGPKEEGLKAIKNLKKINILKNFNNIMRNKLFYKDVIFNKETPFYYKDINKFMISYYKLKSVFLMNNSHNIESNRFVPQTPLIGILAFLGLSLSSYSFSNYTIDMLAIFPIYAILIYALWYSKSIKFFTAFLKNVLLVIPVLTSASIMINNYSIMYKKVPGLDSIITSYLNYIIIAFLISTILYVFINMIICLYNLLFKHSILSNILNLQLFYVILYIMIMTM